MSLCNIFTHHIYKESNTFYSWSRTLLIRCRWQFDCRLWVWILSCCSHLAFIVGWSIESWAILLRFSRRDRSVETFHHLFIISRLLINVCTVFWACAVRILFFISLGKKKKKSPENTIMASLQTAQPSQHPSQEKEKPKTNSPVTRAFFKAHIAQSYQNNAVYCYCDYRINRSL